MSLVRSSARGVLAALTIGLLAPGCVRLLEPDAFSCVNDDDCLANEHCSQEKRLCIADGSCESNADCDGTQSCTGDRCVAAECYDGAPASCGRFQCNTSERACYKDCSAPAYHCSEGNVCRGGTCVAPPELANGAPCELAVECSSRICCQQSTGKACSSACAVVGATCAAGSDCASAYCCPATGRNVCSAFACEGGAACATPAECASQACVSGVCAPKLCATDFECEPGWCAGGACETVPRKPGEACSANRWCASGDCRSGLCHGNGGLDDACTSDSDCATGRSCCRNAAGKKACSVTNQGCVGGNGESCAMRGDAACLSGLCLGKMLCSAACKTDDDCGLSPWSTRNSCVQNAAGNQVCFPGCNTNQECVDHLATHFYCAEKTTVGAQKASVCSGDLYQDNAVQIRP